MSRPTGRSPRTSKRIKLGSDDDLEDVPSTSKDINEGDGEGDELDGEHCSICLQLLLDRTVIPECSHEFCFECIVTWSEQSRRCPLCTRTIGPYLIHNIRSNYDYQNYHLPPLISSPPPIQPLRSSRRSSVRRRPGQERRWGRRERRDQDAVDELERAIDRRRCIYQNHLFAKHVGSNLFTRYRPFPTPTQFAASQDYISRTTIFVRRELRVWVNLDVEFLTTFILSLMKAIDIRSESAIKLLAEFLDMDQPYSEGRRFPNAEHFAHELYSFIRSPYKTLSAYDVNVQYDDPKRPRRDPRFDRTSATERRIEDEVTQNSSRGRPHDTEWSPLRDGGDRFGSKLNDEDTNGDMDQRSSVPRRAKHTEDRSEDSDALSNNAHIEAWPNKQAKACASRTTTNERSRDSHPTNLNELPASSLQMNLKGKQRTSAVDDLEVRITDGHNSGCVPQEASESPRIEPKEEPRRSPSNAPEPIDTGEHPILRRSDGSNTEEFNRNSAYPMQKQLRIRNPLHIAQAHLSEYGTHPKLKRPHRTSATKEDVRPNLRVTSQRDSERPSLLLRLSDPNHPKAESGEITQKLPQTDLDVPPHRGKYVRPANDELRAKLEQRLEAERVAQAVHKRDADDMRETSYSVATQHLSPVRTSSPSTSDTGDASGPAEGKHLLDLEARSRARARLSMKLIVEKHLQASRTRPGKAEGSDLEENFRVAETREGMLRTVLENRRRGV